MLWTQVCESFVDKNATQDLELWLIETGDESAINKQERFRLLSVAQIR